MRAKNLALIAALAFSGCSDSDSRVIIHKPGTPSTCPTGTKAVSSVLSPGVEMVDYDRYNQNIDLVPSEDIHGYLIVTCSDGSGAVSKVTR